MLYVENVRRRQAGMVERLFGYVVVGILPCHKAAFYLVTQADTCTVYLQVLRFTQSAVRETRSSKRLQAGRGIYQLV